MMSNRVRSGGGSGSQKRVRPQGDKRAKELNNPNKLRIIAGKARGKKLESPDVYLRPMMAKVREALFSTLVYMELFDSSENLAVLDMFAGSGSVGLEALSRGATQACFVDLAPECTSTVLRNADACGFAQQASVVTAKAQDVLRSPEKYGCRGPFNLISITPPYEEVLYTDLISAVCESPLVVEDTILVMEYPVEMGSLPQILGQDKFYGLRNRKYGRTMLALYVYRPTFQYDMRPEEFGSVFGTGMSGVDGIDTPRQMENAKQ